RIFALPFLIACAAASVWAWRASWIPMLAAAAAVAFFTGGALLAADAWREAWRPTLRIVFDDLARAARVDAAADHRILPEDAEAFAVVEGVLRQDGAITPAGASLSIDVDAICTAASFCNTCSATLSGSQCASCSATLLGSRQTLSGSRCARVAGGVMATVTGSLATEQVDLWRAGRRVRLPIQLRRPARYLDPGVPDHERALARRG